MSPADGHYIGLDRDLTRHNAAVPVDVQSDCCTCARCVGEELPSSPAAGAAASGAEAAGPVRRGPVQDESHTLAFLDAVAMRDIEGVAPMPPVSQREIGT